MKKKFFIILFLLLGLTQKVFAYSSDPKQFIQEIVDEAKKVLVDTNTKEFKTKKLSEMALKTVDIKGVAFYSLGSYRKDLSEEQLAEYLVLFEKYFLKSFSSRLAEYTDPKIYVESQKKLNDKYTMVSSILMATDDKPEVKIKWRIVTKDPDRPLIIDVIIEGVSLAKVQKEEFNSIIQSNDEGIEALLKNLKEFVNN